MSDRRSIRLRDYDYTQSGAYFVTLCTHERLPLFGAVVSGEMVCNAWGQIVQACWDEIPAHYPMVELDAFVVMPNHVHGIIVIMGGDSVGAQYIAPLRSAASQQSQSSTRMESIHEKSIPMQSGKGQQVQAQLGDDGVRAQSGGNDVRAQYIAPLPSTTGSESANEKSIPMQSGNGQHVRVQLGDEQSVGDDMRVQFAGMDNVGAQSTGDNVQAQSGGNDVRAQYIAPLQPPIQQSTTPQQPPKRGATPNNVTPNSLGSIVRTFKAAVTRQINRLPDAPDHPLWQRNYYEHIIRNEAALNHIHAYIVSNPAKWAEDALYTE